MATILLQAAGAALGGVFGPVGAAIGRAAGALAGNALDRAVLSGSTTVSGSRLSSARIPGADEGAAIARLYGTARIGGTLIWATRFEEEVVVERKGGKAGGSRVESFRYYANFAIGLCEGPVAVLRRVWADGRELDLTAVEMRFYRGTGEQQPDPLIEAKQGEGQAPAYHGLAYVVFERLPLDGFGNRIPFLQFEVIRPVGRLEEEIRAITVIPGATEWGYATQQVRERSGDGSARILNRNGLTAATDWQASIDELTAICPNLESVALVVTWFGTDLRAGQCRIRPGAERAARDGESLAWRVCGRGRGEVYLVSAAADGPAYGGTPADASVLQAIADLRARGLKVLLYPFVMMDVAPGNALPDPYGGEGQPAYPWRGRITCDPAPGRPGTADRTAAAGAQVAAFCGTATAAGFSTVGGLPAFAGADEGYRRFILHYALLAKAAGGVDGFVVGSELRGLTTLRGADGGFPFVAALGALAAEVKAVLGSGAKITYAADWSEYLGYHPADGSGDVYFHLDPLWAHPAIDAVGIDNYMPLSDWRDGDLSAANPDGFRLADDADAMRAQITAGEGFDWYYAGDGDRKARLRTPITDGLAGKPWVFRYKDLESWWSNPHHERVNGVESPEPTAWIAGSKPVWFTELGCPAIDKGATRPNVFPDEKSSENARPWFSSGARADSQQRRFLEAHLAHWRDSGMVDPENIFLWAWDARPYPAFPQTLDLWSDGGNWRAGHWLNGRLGAATLADTLAAILADHGVADFDVSAVGGDLGGYAQGEVASARDLIEPLLEVFQIGVSEAGGSLRFRSLNAASLPLRVLSVLAEEKDAPLWRENRGHDSDFAVGAILNYHDSAGSHEPASVRSRRLAGDSARLLQYSLGASMDGEAALAAAEARLRSHRLARRSLHFALPPQEAAIEAGDMLSLAEGPGGHFLVTRIEDGDLRRIEAREFLPAAAAAVEGAGTKTATGGGTAANAFAPLLHFMDLPRYESGEAPGFARAAALARPWRRIALSSSAANEGYRVRALIERPARTGRLAAPLGPGVSGRFDRANALELELAYGNLASAPEDGVLNGDNRLAVLAANGAWEVIGFAAAEEIAAGRWRLTGLLRGLGGSEDAMAAGAPAASACVVLDAGVVPLGLTAEEAGLERNWIAEASGLAGGMAGPFAFTGGVRAETPLAPVHLRAARAGNGDIRLRWTRRGRIEADSWLAAEIPLDEETEGYRVEILSGAAVLRQAETGAPALLYTAAEELADFGAPQASLSVRIRQKGRAVALGLPAEARLYP